MNMLVSNCITFSAGARGGTERRLISLIHHFENLGIHCFIIEYNQSSINYGSDCDVKRIRRLFSEGFFGDILRIISYTVVLFGFCIKNRIDAVYINRQDPFENIVSPFLLSKFLRKPLIMIMHHIPPERKISINRLLILWKIRGVSQKGILWRILTTPIRRYIHANVDAAITVSKDTAKDVREFLKPNRVFYAGNGVDLKKFNSDINSTKIYDACYLGRIDKFKGIDVLLRCWRIVVDQLPQSKFLLIGEGNEQYIAHCKALIRDLSLDDNIIFTGWITDDEVVRLLGASKIFVFSSKLEGFALAVAEAMACGLCCVISDIPVLRENFSGAADFANPDNHKEFADRVIYYLMNNGEREKLAHRAQEFAKSFRWEHIAETESKIIRSIVLRTNVSN
jgi:glycosyltransferase involved in cell wall biosynthesis